VLFLGDGGVRVSGIPDVTDLVFLDRLDLICIFAGDVGENTGRANEGDTVAPGVALVPNKAFFPVTSEFEYAFFVLAIGVLFSVLDEALEVVCSLP